MKTIVDYFRNLIMFIFLPIPLAGLDFRGQIGGAWNTWMRSPGFQTRAEREFSQVSQLGWVWIGMFLSVLFILVHVVVGETSSLGMAIFMTVVWFIVLTPQIMKSYQVWVWNEVNTFVHKMHDLSISKDRNKCVCDFIKKKSVEAEKTGDFTEIKYIKHVLRVLDLWDGHLGENWKGESC